MAQKCKLTKCRLPLCVPCRARYDMYQTLRIISRLILSTAIGGARSLAWTVAAQMVLQVVCGRTFTLLLEASGSVFSFGRGENGQLGHGDISDRDSPRVIQSLSAAPCKLVAAGKHAALRCW